MHGKIPSKKHENFHRIYKFELEGHIIDLFHDGEWTVKSLVVQFLQKPNCLNVLLLKPNLISDLESWLVFMMFIGILVI